MPFEFPYDDWADIYDAVHVGLDHDMGFYVGQAQASGGPALELGCGTGRVSLAIAEAGVDVVGIDISPLMVETARAKAARRGLTERCIFQLGDMADLRLADRFPLVIMPFRSFQSMLTVDDQRRALTLARAHLERGGLLAMDTFNPDVKTLAHDDLAAVPFHLRDVEREGGGTLIVWAQNGWNPVEQINDVRMIIEEVSDTGVVERRLVRDFEQRYTFRYEMEHLLELCGFVVEAVYGDFNSGPVTESAEDLVWVAKAP